MTTLKAGTRLKSAVCDTEVMVVRASAADIALLCGGVPMIAMDQPKPGGDIDAQHAASTLVGKRYVDPQDQVEFLCTKSGKGSLSVNGSPLTVKQAKALPSSD